MLPENLGKAKATTPVTDGTPVKHGPTAFTRVRKPHTPKKKDPTWNVVPMRKV